MKTSVALPDELSERLKIFIIKSKDWKTAKDFIAAAILEKLEREDAK